MTSTAHFSATAGGPISAAPLRLPVEKSKGIGVWPAVLLFYAIIMPPELAFHIGSMLFTAYRAMLFLFVPWMVLTMVRRPFVPMLADIAVLTLVLWIPISLNHHYGLERAMVSGGAMAGDIALSYLLGRLCFRSPNDLRDFLKLVAPGLVFAGLMMLTESVASRYIFRPLVGRLTGLTAEINELGSGIRDGKFRALGTFPHPILGGAFMASCLPLYLAVRDMGRWKWVGVFASFLGIFSFSSAALLGLILNLLMIGYDKILRLIRGISWRSTSMAIFAFLAVVQIFSQGGVVSIIYRYLTFNPQTGWFRTQTWIYAGADALASPWFGIGMESFHMPQWIGPGTSIDAYFLYLGVTFGIITGILFFLLCVFSIVQLGIVASRARYHSLRKFYAFLAIGMTTQVLMMFTVTYWGSLLGWIFLLLGMAYSLVQAAKAAGSDTFKPLI